MCQKSPGNWTKLLQNGTTLYHIVINEKNKYEKSSWERKDKK